MGPRGDRHRSDDRGHPDRGRGPAERSPRRTVPSGLTLRGLDREAFIDRLTHYLAEINATHPFREGNGRTQRAFVQQLARDAGYRIDWRTLNPEQNLDASRAAHRGDNQPLRALLATLITTPEPD